MKLTIMVVFLVLHNLGRTFVEGRKYDKAIEAYELSLDVQTPFGDANLVEVSKSTYIKICSDF